MASSPSIPIAAVDAGSNAIRVSVARLYPNRRIREIQKERYAVRLGHKVFTDSELDAGVVHKALVAFRDIRRLFDHYKVEKYRAVATSATRDASNREMLLGLVQLETGIDLEVIDGDEEARLVRRAVTSEFQGRTSPSLILDLGGGSLEFNVMKGRQLVSSYTFPLGAVRLMETFKIKGEISRVKARKVRQHVLGALQKQYRRKPKLATSVTVACGGNAETLAKIAPANGSRRYEAIDTEFLSERLNAITGSSIARRMKSFDVRKDRAEVMGVAALVFNTLSEWLDLEEILVPGVGVREGVLRDLAAYTPLARRKKS